MAKFIAAYRAYIPMALEVKGVFRIILPPVAHRTKENDYFDRLYKTFLLAKECIFCDMPIYITQWFNTENIVNTGTEIKFHFTLINPPNELSNFYSAAKTLFPTGFLDLTISNDYIVSNIPAHIEHDIDITYKYKRKSSGDIIYAQITDILEHENSGKELYKVFCFYNDEYYCQDCHEVHYTRRELNSCIFSSFEVAKEYVKKYFNTRKLIKAKMESI